VAALSITGSPVTTSGNINIGFAGAASQYVAGDGSLVTFPSIPSISGLVPYTGATQNVNLGTHSLTAADLVINHASGSGVAASITKGGAGEALTVVKSSGSGNAASITGGVTLLDELHLTTDLADAYIASAATWNAKQSAITLTTTGNSGASTFISNTLNIPTYTLAGLGGINLSSLSATSPLLYDNTTGVFSIQQSSASQAGFLSSADWTTFNSKQSALTNPVTLSGSITTNYHTKWTGTNTIGNSLIWDNGTNVGIGNQGTTYTLDVSGTGRFTGALRVDHSTAGAYGAVIYNTSATGQGLTVRGGSTSSQDAFNVQTYDGNRSLLSVQGGGNVGIGTSSPSTTLDVNGATKITGGGNTLTLAKSGGYPAIAWQGATYTNLIESGDNYMAFYQSGAERMRIQPSGNLILSRTTFSSIQAVGCYDDTSAGARSLSITSSGAIVAVPSSLRYKKDVETLDSNISESIYKMRPIWYRSISNHDRDDWSWYGLIAEEIAEIEPRLVQWGYKREDYIINEETKEQELKEGAELQADGVDYARITVLLVAEMQKMNQIIQDLQSRLDNAGL
jgi:hypothetical protein